MINGTPRRIENVYVVFTLMPINIDLYLSEDYISENLWNPPILSQLPFNWGFTAGLEGTRLVSFKPIKRFSLFT